MTAERFVTDYLAQGLRARQLLIGDDFRFGARRTGDFALLAEMDVIIICVPTPLTAHRDPDLSYVTATAEEIARHISPATLVVLESTTYPGTTVEVVAPILKGSGLRLGADVFIGFSPEREDPGNASYRTATIPKIVAGEGPQAGRLVEAFYGRVVEQIVPVSSSNTTQDWGKRICGKGAITSVIHFSMAALPLNSP